MKLAAPSSIIPRPMRPLRRWGPLLSIVAASVPPLGFAGPIAVDPNSLINVQFGENSADPVTQPYAGAAVFSGGSQNNWNLVTGPDLSSGVSGTNIPLRSAAGTSTGASLSYVSAGSFYNSIGSGGIFVGTPQEALMTSYLYSPPLGAPGNVTISGLTPNAYYQVLPYSAADYVGRGTTFTVGSVQQTVTPTATPTLSLGQTFGEFVAHADPGGNIALSMSAAGTSALPEANLNGLQILPVPVVAAHDLINVQFGSALPIFPTTPYGGPGVVSSIGNDHWNLITDATKSTKPSGVALVDAAGSATTVSLNYSALNFYNAGLSGVLARTPEQALLTSYAYADSHDVGGPAYFTFSGLNAGEPYELILDSAADDVGRGTLFNVGGVSQGVSPSGAQVQGVGDSFAEFFATADSLGDILFSMAAYGAGGVLDFPEANLNGIQLIALPASVPEPSTIWTLMTGLVTVTLMRKRSVA